MRALQSFFIIPRHSPIFRLCSSFRIRMRCVRLARDRSLVLTWVRWVLARGLTAGRCIKRFIFTRMVGSRASWHNASGNNRAFRTPSRYFDRRKPSLCRSVQHTDGSWRRSIGVRAYYISSINVHIASTLTTIFRPARFTSFLYDPDAVTYPNVHCFLLELRFELIPSANKTGINFAPK